MCNHFLVLFSQKIIFLYLILFRARLSKIFSQDHKSYDTPKWTPHMCLNFLILFISPIEVIFRQFWIHWRINLIQSKSKAIPLFLQFFFQNFFSKFFFQFFLGSDHLNSKFRCGMCGNCAGAVIFEDTVVCVDNNHNNSCPHIVVVQ